MALVDVEYQAPEGFGVLAPLGPAVHAAWVAHHEAEDFVADGISLGRWHRAGRRRPTDRTHQRGEHFQQPRADLVRATARSAGLLDNLLDARPGQPKPALVVTSGQQQPRGQVRQDRGADIRGGCHGVLAARGPVPYRSPLTYRPAAGGPALLLQGPGQEPLPHQPDFRDAVLAGDLEQLQAPVARRAGLDARHHLLGTAEVTVRRHQKTAQRVVGAGVVVEVQVRREPPLHLTHVHEALHVDELVDAQLRQQRGEALDASPGPERTSLVVHHHLRLPVEAHRLLEDLDHHVGALGLIHPVAHHEARMIVDEDERERGRPVDVPMHEVQMPDVVRAHGLGTPVVWPPLDLGRPVAGVLHDAADGVHRDLHAPGAQLVADLARPEPGVLSPLSEDLWSRCASISEAGGPLVGDSPSLVDARSTFLLQS